MSLANPPPGANNFSCKPSAAHPNPVVLVHGLGATMGENWGYLSPLLAARGYCVFALTYGIDPRFPYAGGEIPIEQSAPELAAFVDSVLAATHTSQVDLVGHSEGTFMPEYWLKYLGGQSKVNVYVAMTPLYAGSTVYAVSELRDALAPLGLSQPAVDLVAQDCGSCPEFLAGSPMVQKLNAGGAAVPGVQYTTIPTRYDELVTPYTSGILHAPNVTNKILQDVCPNDLSEHLAEAVDPVVAQIVFNALDPPHQHSISCVGLPAAAPPSGSGPAAPSGGGPAASSHPRRFACARPSGRLAGRSLGPVTLGMRRDRVRSRFPRSSTRGRRYMDFFCLTPIGIRVGYPSPMLLHSLSRAQRGHVQGRAVLALTANPHYALRGIRPGARLAKVARRLRIGKGFHIGLNWWYLTSNGTSRGVLKVSHGRIEEVGIADKRLTSNRRVAMRFLKSFA
ncbi:MAG: lipase family alpha/beta hydrolase [Solirubrobacteraceae bacterium]|nr:MAG: hypothetical protein DLM63_08360 [Solirubrobacterales bacterium]